MKFFGYLDKITPKSVSGWAWCQENPQTRPTIQIIITGELIAETVCNQYRADLVSEGIGDGKYGFNIELPVSIFGDIFVIIANDGTNLQGSPVYLDEEETQVLEAAQFLFEKTLLGEKIVGFNTMRDIESV